MQNYKIPARGGFRYVFYAFIFVTSHTDECLISFHICNIKNDKYLYFNKIPETAPLVQSPAVT